MKVVYTGTSDFQEFSKADFAKAGVEQSKVSFTRGQPVDLDDSVVEALVSREGIFGDYSFETVEEDVETEGEVVEEVDVPESPVEPEVPEETPSTSTSTPRTGRATRTAGTRTARAQAT